MSHDAAGAKENLKIFLFGFGGLMVLAFVVFLVISFYLVFIKVNTGNFTLVAAKILHLPALKVNGKRVLYGTYAADLKAIYKMKDFDSQRGGGAGSGLTEENMSNQVLWRLASNILVDEAALAFGVKAEDSEVEALQAQVLSQFKTVADADKELMDRYGWTLQTYTEKVMRPFVLQNKLAEKIQADMEARTAVRAQAEEVLNQIKNGADFVAMAKKYGEDGTAANGGELGWVGRGELVPQFESAAFALRKGDVSDLVETNYGYHIIKLEDAKKEKTRDEKNKTVEVEKISVRHILFRFPSLDKYLNQKMKEADIHLYIKVHDPFEAEKDKLAGGGGG